MRLYWPAVRPDVAAGTGDGDTHTRPASLPKAARVIVVEDEEGVRQLTVRTLASVGLTVTAAKDGPEALRLLHEATAPVDMLLTDVVMPYVSGRQLSEMATELYPGLPVLFISGYAGNEVILRQLIPEGAAFLQKPFTPDELIRAASEVLGSRGASKTG